MPTPATRPPTTPEGVTAQRATPYRGVLLSCLVAAGTLALHRVVPASPLLVAILVGVLLANVGLLPASTQPGLAWSGRHLLRAGVVLLGLQLSLADIAALGPGVVLLVVVVVGAGIAGALWIGRRAGLEARLSLLIGCGFSICGAAAVAAVAAADPPVDDEEGDGAAATAVGLVVLFGTLMIAVVPAGVAVLDLGARAGGLWAGASIHEVAQVVAAGGAIGGGALAVAVVVKLARVLMLAPVLGWVSWRHRRRLQAAGTAYAGDLPPLVPGFVLGFAAAVLLATWAPLPDGLLSAASTAQTLLLSAAMFALGCGVRITVLRRLGATPLVVATAATVWVAAIGLTGALLLG